MNQIKIHLQQHGAQISGVGQIGLGIYWLSIGQTQWGLAIIASGLGFLGLHGMQQYIQDLIGQPDGPQPTVPTAPPQTPLVVPTPKVPPASPPTTDPASLPSAAPKTNKRLVVGIIAAMIVAAGGASAPGVYKRATASATVPTPIPTSAAASVVDETDIAATVPAGVTYAWTVPQQPGMVFRSSGTTGFFFAKLPGTYFVGLSYLDNSGASISTAWCVVTVGDPTGAPTSPVPSGKVAAKAPSPTTTPTPDVQQPAPPNIPPPTVPAIPPAVKAQQSQPMVPIQEPVLTVVIVQSKFTRKLFEETFLRDPAFATALADFDLKYVGPDGKNADGNLDTRLKVYSDLTAGKQLPYYFVVGPPPAEQRLEAGPLTTPADLLVAWKRARGKA